MLKNWDSGFVDLELKLEAARERHFETQHLGKGSKRDNVVVRLGFGC